MKIAIVCPYLPPRIGGREYWVWHMAPELGRLGHEVRVYASHATGHTSGSRRTEIETSGNVATIRLGMIADISRYSVPITKAALWDFLRWKPDILHLCEPELYLCTLYGLLGGAFRKIPLVVHCFSNPADSIGVKGGTDFLTGLYDRVYRLKLAMARKILYLSRQQMELSCLPDRLKRKCEIVPMCVAPAFFPAAEAKWGKGGGEQPARQGDIVYVGRLDIRKGVDLLVRAVGRTDVGRLFLIGSGDRRTRRQLGSLADSLGVADRVVFTGNLPQETVNGYLNCASFLVLPSLTESFGAVLLEAWACRKPVITSDTPAPAAIVREAGGGLVCRRGDVLDLAEKIGVLLHNPGTAVEMGERGYRFVKGRFEYHSTARRLEKIYEEAGGRG